MQEPVTTSAMCEASRCHLCAGQVISLVAASTLCTCPCHDGDDLAVEARLEREHFGDWSL